MLAERIAATQLTEMAAQVTSLSARVHASDLPRVAGLLAMQGAAGLQPVLDVQVEIRAGPESLPLLKLRVCGELPLACQRCFGPVNLPVDVDALLTVAPDEAAAQSLADPFDSVLLDDDGGFRLRDVVEDEILAALPLAPRHAEGDGCGAIPVAEPEPARQVNRPFAGLGRLIGTTPGGKPGK